MPHPEPGRSTADVDHDVVQLDGPLSLASATAARAVLAKALAQRGRVVVDVSRLVLEWEPVVTLFATALSAAGGWPVARLVLFGAPSALHTAMRQSRVLHTVPVALDLPAAVRLLDVRPLRVSRHRDLPADVVSPAAARLYVGDACAEWDVPHERATEAVQIANELVSNAVEHARTGCRLTIALDARGLHVAVRDADPVGVVRSAPVGQEDLRGRGLYLVAVLSAGWGVSCHPDGKTVWARIPV